MFRALKILLWFLAITIALVAVIVLLALTSAVQTAVAHRVLNSVNSGLSGKIFVSRVHVTLSGNVSVEGIRLFDSTGTAIATLDTLRARVNLAALRRDSVHVFEADLRGLGLDLLLDSTGNLNLLQAVSPRVVKPAAVAQPSPWIIRVDTVGVRGLRSRFRQTDTTYLETASWQLAARALVSASSAQYALDLDVPEQFNVVADGSLSLSPPLKDLQGHLRIHADSTYVASLPPPMNNASVIETDLAYQTHEDSLHVSGDVQSSRLGKLHLRTAMPLPLGTLTGRGQIDFDHVTPAVFLHDSISILLNGTLVFTKVATPALLDGWNADVVLHDSHYGQYHLTSARLVAATRDNNLTLKGKMDTGHGRADVDAVVRNFDPVKPELTATVHFEGMDLHYFLPEIPANLLPLSGTIVLHNQGFDLNHIVAESEIALGSVTLGEFALDSLVFKARVNDTAFTIDTLRARRGPTSVSLHAEGLLGGDAQFALRANVPDVRALQLALKSVLPPLDTLHGSLSLDVEGSASLAGNSLSHVRATGTLDLDSLRYGTASVEHTDIRLFRADLDSLSFFAALRVHGVHAGGQIMDSLALFAQGTPRDVVCNLRLFAKGDTVQINSDFEVRPTASDIGLTVSSLVANLYGIHWESVGETNVNLAGTRLELDGFVIGSPMGIIRASGTIQRHGEQDVTLEFSGVKTGELARFFKLPIPKSTVNARIALLGPDSALTGELTLTADSVTSLGSPIADRFVLNATVDRSRALLDGFLIWIGDTLTVFDGRIPARISFEHAFELVQTDSMQGHVQIFPQRLDKLARYLPFGVALTGFVSGDVTFSGTPARPRWLGNFSVDHGAYTDSRVGVRYKNIRVSGQLDGDTLRIPHFDVSSGGNLTGGGWAVMAFPLPSELHLDLKFDGFEVMNSPQMETKATGNLTITGPLYRLAANGRIRLDQAVYRITAATGKDLETIDLKAELAKVSGDTSKSAFMISQVYTSMSNALFLDIPGNTWIRGGGINIELNGSLWLYKDSKESPTINGEIKVSRGTVQFVGREFNVTNGAVTFEGPIADPSIDITATEPRLAAQGVSITIHLTGTMRATHMELNGTDAQGAMTSDKIVEALIGGTGGNSQKIQDALATNATSQLSGVLGRAVGLDVFQLRLGGGGVSDSLLSSGSLEVGTYVTDRLFVRVLQPVQVTPVGQEVSIEYRLFRWLSLRAQQTGGLRSSGSTAFDLLMQVDWR